jgi:hypothetical protein
MLLSGIIKPAAKDSHLQSVTITQAAYIHFRRKPAEDERILINVLYVNKHEFCASSWRSTKVMHSQPIIKVNSNVFDLYFLIWSLS